MKTFIYLWDMIELCGKRRSRPFTLDPSQEGFFDWALGHLQEQIRDAHRHGLITQHQTMLLMEKIENELGETPLP